MKLEEKLRLIRDHCLNAEPAALPFANAGDRWGLYREMVRTRLEGALASTYRRTRARIGEARFSELTSGFLDAQSIATRYFWRVPLLFYQDVLSGLDEAAERELAEYEMLRWTIRHEEAPHLEVPVALDFEKRPLFKAPFAIFRAAHSLREAEAGSGAPQEAAEAGASRPIKTYLLFRDGDERLKELRLNEGAARLIEELSRGELSLAEGVRALSAKEGFAIDQAYLEKLSALLATLVEEGFLLGSIASIKDVSS